MDDFYEKFMSTVKTILGVIIAITLVGTTRVVVRSINSSTTTISLLQKANAISDPSVPLLLNCYYPI
jgi:hypothetical protein